MIINSSAVGMSSNRSYSSYTRKENASITTAGSTGIALELSSESKSLMEQMKEEQTEISKRQEEEAKKNIQESYKQMAERAKKAKETAKKEEVKSKEQIKMETLMRMLEALKRLRSGNVNELGAELKRLKSEMLKSGSQSSYSSSASSSAFAASANQVNASFGTAANSSLWTKSTVTSVFHAEQEYTAYSANGIVKTADGREIGFNVNIEMSRAFCERYEEFTQESYILTDPLVINLDGNIASVSDQKFLFDIDCDGKEDEISFIGKGSGFLALDKNNDGKINDGSELFGAASGDGFAELAQYDKDGNGWIDEADEIFKDLKIWMKDGDGNDSLSTLKEAGVGAIYLGSANTQFSLNNMETNQTNAVIQKTGVYLKESGEVGTIQHIDLAI